MPEKASQICGCSTHRISLLKYFKPLLNLVRSRKTFLPGRDSRSSGDLSISHQSRSAFRHPTTRGPGFDKSQGDHKHSNASFGLRSEIDSENEDQELKNKKQYILILL